jgi:hypothetical protein
VATRVVPAARASRRAASLARSTHETPSGRFSIAFTDFIRSPLGTPGQPPKQGKVPNPEGLPQWLTGGVIF